MSLDIARTLRSIAEEAAILVMEVYAKPFDVDYKAPRDPVTEADRRANELICRRLRAAFPSTPIVAEESEPETFEGFRTAGSIFFVDPVDGTREFVAKNGEFAIMIGYVEGAAPVAGVVHAPAQETTWVGAIGSGTFRARHGGELEPVSASPTGTLSETRLVASRSHRSEEYERILQGLGVREVLTLGSAGLKGAAVADGNVDAYVAPGYAGKRWDACAIDALVTAAGGILTDTEGQPIDYRARSLGNDRGIVAAGAELHPRIIERLKTLRGGA